MAGAVADHGPLRWWVQSCAQHACFIVTGASARAPSGAGRGVSRRGATVRLVRTTSARAHPQPGPVALRRCRVPAPQPTGGGFLVFPAVALFWGPSRRPTRFRVSPRALSCVLVTRGWGGDPLRPRGAGPVPPPCLPARRYLKLGGPRSAARPEHPDAGRGAAAGASAPAAAAYRATPASRDRPDEAHGRVVGGDRAAARHDQRHRAQEVQLLSDATSLEPSACQGLRAPSGAAECSSPDRGATVGSFLHVLVRRRAGRPRRQR